MLQKNNLPTMWFPENPDSGKLLGATFTESAEALTTTENQNIAEDIEGRDHNLETGTRQRTRSNNKPRPEQETPLEAYSTPTEGFYPKRAEDIGLKICVTGKHTIPTQNPHNEYILHQTQMDNFKWTYTNTRYGEEIIRHLFSTNRIKITKHEFKKIDEGTFRKTRNGLINRSPPEDTRRIKK